MSETLMKIVEACRSAGDGPPKVWVIMDLAKDCDEIVAMLVLGSSIDSNL